MGVQTLLVPLSPAVQDFVRTPVRKNEINLQKHKISIPELATVFSNLTTILDIPDKAHSCYEDRYYALGWISTGFYVLVWYNIVKLIQSE